MGMDQILTSMRFRIVAIAGGFALACLTTAVQAQESPSSPIPERAPSLFESMHEQLSKGFLGLLPVRLEESVIPAATAKALGIGDGTAKNFPSFADGEGKISRRVLFIPNDGGYILELYKANTFSVILLDRNEKMVSAVTMPITVESPVPIPSEEAQRLCDSEKGYWNSLISKIMVD